MVGRALLLVLLAPYALWLVFDYEYHFLDGVNLLFHEAGHVFFGLLGQTLQFLGGTLGQLFFPVSAALHFVRQGRAFDAWICVLWLGESLMYAAEYIADARRQLLPLVGGHIHDWHWLLSRCGLLDHAERLGATLHAFASVVVLGALGAAAREVWREYRQRAEGSAGAAALH